MQLERTHSDVYDNRFANTAEPFANNSEINNVYEQIRRVDGQQGGLTIERMCALAVVR
jgi:hypothetical protein